MTKKKTFAPEAENAPLKTEKGQKLSENKDFVKAFYKMLAGFHKKSRKETK